MSCCVKGAYNSQSASYMVPINIYTVLNAIINYCTPEFFDVIVDYFRNSLLLFISISIKYN